MRKKNLGIKGKTKRLNRFKAEPKKAPNLHIQKRDQEIIRSVHNYKFLTGEQINRLHFNTSMTAVNRRLLLLFHHGYLSRAFQPEILGRTPAIYYMDKKGYQVLEDAYGIEVGRPVRVKKDVTLQFLSHELAVSDFFIDLNHRHHGMRTREVLFWERTNSNINTRVIDKSQSKTTYIPVQPDGFYAVRDKRTGKVTFTFLEVDMGTMRLSRIRTKLIGYKNLVTGREVQRIVLSAMSRREIDLGQSKGGIKVLFVVTSPKRQENILSLAKASGMPNLVRARYLQNSSFIT